MSIDEAMIASKHRSFMRQYMRNKLVKWGFKIWCLACPFTGYVYRFTPYIGIAPGESAHKGLAFDVVIGLATGLSAGSAIVADRFFTGPALALALMAMGIHLLGTIQSNRKGMPKDLYKNIPKKAESRGVHFWHYCKDTKLRVVSWYDNKWVTLISTFGRVTGATVKRVVTKNKVRSVGDIPAPWVVLMYNRLMGGVDLGDQLRSAAKIEKTFGTKKWHHKLFLGLFAMAMTNAFILYKTFNSDASSRKFRIKLQLELLERAGSRFEGGEEKDETECELGYSANKFWRCSIEGCRIKPTHKQAPQTHGYCEACLKGVCNPNTGRNCWKIHCDPRKHPSFGRSATRHSSKMSRYRRNSF
jgi:hypothetical protein